MLVLNGFPEDPPNYPAGELGYKELALAAAEAALALVMERRHGGVGGRVTVSLQEAVNFTTIQTANANWLHWQDRVPGRAMSVGRLITHKAADGRWVTFTIHPPNWPKFAEWVHSELGTDEVAGEEWNDGSFRAVHAQQVADLSRQMCLRYDREELIEQGQRRGLLVLPVNTVADIATDPHLRAREFFQRIAIPGLKQEVTLPRSAFLSSAHEQNAAPPPILGADTEAVLRDVGGLSEGICDVLFADGVAVGSRGGAGSPATVPRRRPDRATRPKHQPLSGVRILDFCWAIAGPLGTRLLADLGADVIKVESEYRLDPIRQIGVQPKGAASWNTNGQFNDCNTNKRAITLNLNTDDGLAVVRRLAATADVITSNYTPDRLDRWGLGYDDLRAIKPDIIVANWAVMGIRGPHAGWRSYGSGIVGMCGLAELTGFPERDPIGLGTLHTDFTVPYFAAIQVMSALIHHENTGQGQYLELAQYETAVHLLDTELVEYLNGGEAVVRRGNRSRRFVPHGVFPSAGEDRWVAVACRDDTDWERLRSVPGLEQLRRIDDRWTAVEEVEATLSAWTSRRDRWSAAAELQAAGVPASAVEDLQDLLGADVAMRNSYAELALPSGVTALVQHEPITWDGERLPISRAPLWGEHTAAVLGELGYADEEIAELAAAGALF